MTQNSVIQLDQIHKSYYVGLPNELEILHGIDLDIKAGQFVAIVGFSGSGKSTLMNIIGALDRPTQGIYVLDDRNIQEAEDQELSAIRNAKIGFVFQNFNLIPRLSAIKNVELPMAYAGRTKKERTVKATQLLEQVGMVERAHHLPNELSGGEKQRIAIARALANDPAIILADEPTGSLDSKTGRKVMDIFHDLHRGQGKTIILITHSNELAEEADIIITIKDGLIVSKREGRDRR
jgi:putative ABC transport system ATP-binding protein